MTNINAIADISWGPVVLGGVMRGQLKCGCSVAVCHKMEFDSSDPMNKFVRMPHLGSKFFSYCADANDREHMERVGKLADFLMRLLRRRLRGGNE